MTDEQWLWLFVHRHIDTDEQLESMCQDCREEVTSRHKCTRCGKSMDRVDDSFINPNFDSSKFNKIKNDIDASDVIEELK